MSLRGGLPVDPGTYTEEGREAFAARIRFFAPCHRWSGDSARKEADAQRGDLHPARNRSISERQALHRLYLSEDLRNGDRVTRKFTKGGSARSPRLKAAVPWRSPKRAFQKSEVRPP